MSPSHRAPLPLTAYLVVVFLIAPLHAAVVDRYGDCSLEDIGGLRVLHLKGTPAEMGYAHGRLLAEQIQTVTEALSRTFRRELEPEEQTDVAAAARPHVPGRFVDEVLAIAAGANDALGEEAISPDRLLELHSWDEICHDVMERGSTAHFAAMRSATATGHVLVGVDYTEEQCVRRGVQDGAVLIVYEPNKRHMFCTISYAGFAGAMVGINSQGLAVSESRFPTDGQRTDGTPLPFQVRRVLEECSDVGSAEAVLRSIRRTVSANVLVADGLGGDALRVFEAMPGRFEVFREGDPGEEHIYFVRANAVSATGSIEGFSGTISVPDTARTVAMSHPLPDAIVRAATFIDHAGATPLLARQCSWILGYPAKDPDFDFFDISHLPVEYPYPSLDAFYVTNKMLGGQTRDMLNPLLAAFIDAISPGWDLEFLYIPEAAGLARYWALSDAVAERLGTLDPSSVMTILGKGVTPAPPTPLLDPNSLHCVVIDATTMELWVATAAPKETEGKPDAGGQPFRKFDFGARVTYPLTIRTTPVIADVIVNGEPWGRAPLTRRLRPGQYLIAFGHVDGYITPKNQIVTVGADGATVTGTYVEGADEGTNPTDDGTTRLDIAVEGEGTVEYPEGPQDPGTVVTLTAKPATCWEFAGWTGNLESSDEVIEFPLYGVVTLRAVFAEKQESTLTIEILGEGEVAATPAGAEYPCGTEVALEAVAPGGETAWEFIEWRGDVESPNNPLTISIERDMTVVAVFSQKLDVPVGRETPAPCCGAPAAALMGLLLVVGLLRAPRVRR